LFLGFDTHALSGAGLRQRAGGVAGNEVEVMIAKDDEYTPTPALACHPDLQPWTHELADGT
jgi:phosphoglucomutase